MRSLIRQLAVLCVAAVAAAATTFATPAAAQASTQGAWPTRAIRMFGPGQPGGASAVLARLMVDPLGEQLGQPIVYESKPGPGGVPPAEAMLAAPADGYTLLMTTAATHGILPATRRRLSFDLTKDFTPIAKLVEVPMVLYVNKDVPARTLPELVALAKARPGQLNYSSLGAGGTTHLAMVMLMGRLGIEMVHVPFNGSAPALTQVIGGQVQVGMDLAPGVIGHVRAGSVRAIAVTTALRMPDLPDVPTVMESGGPAVSDYEVASWYGIVARAGTPKVVVDRIAAEATKLLAKPDVQARLRQFGAQPALLGPAAFEAYIQKELLRWPPVVKASGMTIEN